MARGVSNFLSEVFLLDTYFESGVLAGVPISYLFFEGILVILIMGIFGAGFFLLSRKFSRNFSRKIKIVCLLILSVLLCCLFWGSIIEPRRIVIRRFNIENKKLPELKLLIISDLHASIFKSKRFFSRVVKKINSEQDIDAVFILGDTVWGDSRKYLSLLQDFSRISLKPKFVVLGNHDHFKDKKKNERQVKKIREFFESMGILELNNDAVLWREKNVNVVGVDDLFLGFDDLKKALGDIKNSNLPTIFLSHSPDIFAKFEKKDYPDLILSGHTHCGQVRFPIIGSVGSTLPIKYKKDIRKHWNKEKNLFVTCGLGEVGIRARFLNPPEIVILEINS